MLTIRDLKGNEEALTDFKELTLIRRVNGEKQLSMTLLPTDNNKHSFPMVAEECILTFDNEEYVIKQITERSLGNTYIKRVEAIHKFYVDMINKQQPNIHNGSMTFANYLSFVFDGTGYTFSIIDTFYAQDFENLGNDNRLALLQKGLERYKAEMEIVGTTVRFRSKVGNDTDFQFRYGHNIKSIERHVDTTDLATVINGRWEDGMTLEYRSPNADVLGEIDAPLFDNEWYTTQATRLQAMKDSLQDEPDVSLTIDFVDLRAAGYPWTVPNEGDRVFVIYEPMNDLLLETRILEIREVFNANFTVIKTEVTLANHKKTFAGTMFDNVDKRLKDIVGDNGKIKYNVLDEAVKIATEAIKSAQTELEFINGITGRDKDNPNFLTRFTSRGIGVSSDGGNTFPDAIVRGRINTSLLTAGQIKTNNIQIVGEDNLFYWDGAQLIAIDANDLNKYVKLNSGGLEVRKGMVYVEREDGLATIIGGRLNVDFAIQGSNPAFTVDTEVIGRYFKTSKHANLGGGQCNLYTFRRIDRYLKIEIALARESGTIATAYASIFQSGGSTALATVSSTDDVGFESIRTLTVDLGVPDGQTYAVVLKLMTNNETMPVYCRVNRIYQTGFN